MKSMLKTLFVLTLFIVVSGCVYDPGYVRRDGYDGAAYYEGSYGYSSPYYDYGYSSGYYGYGYGYGYPAFGIGLGYYDHYGRGNDGRGRGGRGNDGHGSHHRGHGGGRRAGPHH
jgi:hypothetical protein